MKIPEPLIGLERKTLRRIFLTNNQASEVICQVAMADKLAWTPQDWAPVLSALMRCDDLLEDWLALRL